MGIFIFESIEEYLLHFENMKLMVFTVRYNFGGFAWLDILGFCSGWKGNADSGKCVGGE